jgi:hypothetical protein
VLGDRSKGKVVVLGDCTHAHASCADALQNVTSGRVAQGPEDGVQCVCLFNHVVE